MSYAKRPLPIGQKYGMLIILEEVPTFEKCRRYVKCQCDCGSIKTVRFDSLKSQRIKSCGCLVSIKSKNVIEKMLTTRKRNKEKILAENYIGKKFNKLTIQSICVHLKHKGTWFNVKCDCGKTLPVSLMRIKLDHTKSCGCLKRKSETIVISSVDEEIIHVSNGKHQYKKILGSTEKEAFHVHEAKKVFRLLGKKWSVDYVIHHIDGDKHNNDLSNLAVLDKRAHQKQHKKLEIAMYKFLISNNLIDEFYKKNSDLILTTLADLCKHI